MTVQRYERPLTTEAAVDLLSTTSGTAAVLAGGTDLVADIRLGRNVDLLVDIKKIPEMSYFGWTPDGALVIGACVTVQQVAENAAVRQRYPVLASAAEHLGSYQVRCRATIAGNLGNASPCADVAPALLVLQARVRIASRDGRREVPLHGFIRNVKQTALAQGEIITAVVVPSQPASLHSAFQKIKRIRGHDLALVNAAGAFDSATRELRLAIGSAACTPVLVEDLDGICPPGAGADEVGEHLAEKALAAIRPIDDVRASAEYRNDMTALLCRRLAHALMSSAE